MTQIKKFLFENDWFPIAATIWTLGFVFLGFWFGVHTTQQFFHTNVEKYETVTNVGNEIKMIRVNPSERHKTIIVEISKFEDNRNGQESTKE
jgi:hypothetical protein